MFHDYLSEVLTFYKLEDDVTPAVILPHEEDSGNIFVVEFCRTLSFIRKAAKRFWSVVGSGQNFHRHRATE